MKFAKKNNILITFDEMQSGFARTGKNFGYQHYEVVPDLICTGKGMGGGVPLSGVIGRAEIMDLPEVGNMSSTHSANPLVCSAGMAVLEEIENNNLVSQTNEKKLPPGLTRIMYWTKKSLTYVFHLLQIGCKTLPCVSNSCPYATL